MESLQNYTTNPTTVDVTVYAYCRIVIAVYGVIGNISTVAVFHKGLRCHKSWCALYFKVLAIADIYILLTSNLLNALSELGYTSVTDAHVVLCKYYCFNYDFSIQISTWITVVVTIDRALSVSFPLQLRTMFAPKWMYIKLSAICTVFVASNIVWVFKAYINDYGMCDIDVDWFHFYLYTLISEGLFVFLFPSIINLMCNVVILRALYRRASSANQIGLSDSHVTSRQSEANSAMYRVIAIGTVHFLSTLPAMADTIIHMYNLFSSTGYYVGEQNDSALVHLSLSAYTLLYLTSALNFTFYCLVGADVRQDLKDMFCCCQN